MTEKIESIEIVTMEIKSIIKNADAILVGVGSGLSTSAGFTYSGKRFYKYFSDFSKKYGFSDMYSGGFSNFESLEEYWGYWCRHIFVNRYMPAGIPVYEELFRIVKNKEYFVITTNVDHCFQKSGFDKARLFYTQGDYGLWQCSKPCHKKTYDNEETVRKMIESEENFTKMTVPSELVPKCPKCNAPMTMNLRCDNTFVEDEFWHKAAACYQKFLEKYQNKKIVFLELGVGGNTPGIIKYPFWNMTHSNPDAKYICINKDEPFAPPQIASQTICVDNDIYEVLKKL